MSNANLMMSLAGISGGLGRASSKKELTGVAKERMHLKNLQPWEQSAAKDEYKSILDKLKADRAAAIAEWYTRYPAAMPIEYKKIDKVVAAFLVGKVESAPNSAVTTDGGSLVVQGQEVAKRDSANSRFITVCPGLFGESKAARYTANSALRHMGAGIRVTDIMRGKGDEGFAFFTPMRSPMQGRILSDRCVRVEVDRKARQSAMKAAYGDEGTAVESRDSAGPAPSSRRRGPAKHGRYYGRTKADQSAAMARLSAKYASNPKYVAAKAARDAAKAAAVAAQKAADAAAKKAAAAAKRAATIAAKKAGKKP